MNLHDLEVFLAAARARSVTRAATELGTVQSNVTTRIRVLESDLGAQLFRRDHRGVELTAKGQELVPLAQQIIALVGKARDQISGKEREPSGRMRLGAVQTTAAARLPELLKRYSEQFEHVAIAVETGMSSELIEKVLDRRIAGAFVSAVPERPDLQVLPAFVEEVVALTHPACRSLKSYLSADRIPKILVYRTGCSYRQKLEHFLLDAGFPQLDEMEFGTFDGIIGCVGAGLGLTMLPRSVVERSARRREVRVHALPGASGRMEVAFVTRKGDVSSSALLKFVELLAAERLAQRSNGRHRQRSKR